MNEIIEGESKRVPDEVEMIDPATKVVICSIMLRADKFPADTEEEIFKLFREWILNADDLHAVVALSKVKMCSYIQAIGI